MAQVNIRLDDATKSNAEVTLAALGLTIPVIVNMLLKQVIRTGTVPFEITTGQDPFYSESNMKYLYELKKEVDEGKATYVTKTWEELEAMVNEHG